MDSNTHLDEQGKKKLLSYPQQRHLLVVEDEHSIGLFIQAGLQALASTLTVILASTAEEALRILRSRPVEVVVSDYRMPGMDGLSLARQIISQWPTTRVILMTAHSLEDLQSSAGPLPIAAFLSKPFRLQALRQAVKPLLEAK